jgi:hypothetical protein
LLSDAYRRTKTVGIFQQLPTRIFVGGLDYDVTEVRSNALLLLLLPLPECSAISFLVPFSP